MLREKFSSWESEPQKPLNEILDIPESASIEDIRSALWRGLMDNRPEEGGDPELYDRILTALSNMERLYPPKRGTKHPLEEWRKEKTREMEDELARNIAADEKAHKERMEDLRKKRESLRLQREAAEREIRKYEEQP